MTPFIQAAGKADLRSLKLGCGNPAAGRKILRERKAAGRAPGDKEPSDKQSEPAMCCQIPPCHDFRPIRAKPADGSGLATRAWASFAAGVVLLSLSLASAIWLAARLA